MPDGVQSGGTALKTDKIRDLATLLRHSACSGSSPGWLLAAERETSFSRVLVGSSGLALRILSTSSGCGDIGP